MSSEEREPDTTDPGLGREVGEGLPEEQPAGAAPHDEDRDKTGRGRAGERAPTTDPGTDSDPDKATGNPGAAG
jgi:hypothetical protein